MNKNDTNITATYGRSNLIDCLAIISASKATKKLVIAFARLGTSAKATREKIIELSNTMRDDTILKDIELIKNAKSQSSNWSRRNKYKPIYRKSIIS